MEPVEIARMDNVLLQVEAECTRGVLSLTKHHIIFRREGHEERSVPYALIASVTRQASLISTPSLSSGRSASPSPTPPQLGDGAATPAGPSAARAVRIFPLLFRLRTFEALSLGFDSEARATLIFDRLRETAIASSVEDLYAFAYRSRAALPTSRGWSIYRPEAEFQRQGVGSRSNAWRFTAINGAYEFCPTYPAELVVPTRISDTTLQHAAKYRSKARLPALSYLHWANNASITRCAQPLPGLKQARSVQDEKVVEAVFASHLSPAILGDDGGASISGPVYGATTTNVIVDARPTTNAVATYARGGGTENMDHYKGCKKAYLGIENIHVMRDSINRVVDALRAADEPTTFGMVDIGTSDADERAAHDDSVAHLGPPSLASSDRLRRAKPMRQPLDVASLKRSNWLRHLSCLLEGTALIVRNLHVASSHVLIHCSDGWDRTSQLSALSQVCLDPYFRTMEGFAVLVEKEWLSFGHRFTDRCGHGGSEKHYTTASGHGASADDEDSDEADASTVGAAAGGGAQAAATALWGFTKQLTANLGGGNGASSSTNLAAAAGPGSHIKEASPVFTQFLDCVWQIMRQNPQRFEFNQAWLVALHRELYECRFGTFLCNSERERRTSHNDGGSVVERTASVWDFMLSENNRDRFKNPQFDAKLDEPKRADADMGVLSIKSNDVRWWAALFGQRIEEANQALDFEESERKRRKAEKQRWEEERLLRKEQEEKSKREMEAEQNGSRVAVGGMQGGGAVDLTTASALQRQQHQEYQERLGGTAGQTVPSPLAYQPRAPRSKSAPRSAAHTAETASVPSSSRQPQHQQVAQASEAAARFKSWAIGGWDRFQEAMAGSPATESSHRDETVLGHGLDGQVRGNSGYSSAMSNQSSADAPIEANPWATRHVGEGQHSGASNPWREERGSRVNAAADTLDSLQISSAMPSRGSKMDMRQGSNMSSAPESAAIPYRDSEPAPTRRTETSTDGSASAAGRPGGRAKVASSDPLGVGPL
ncbi:unnamed protein product [Parajaminaea phylloscopi]